MMFRKAHYVALGIVLLLTVIVFKLPTRTATKFKVALGSLFLPLFGLAGSVHQITERSGDLVTPRSDLLKQNDQLRSEVDALKFRNSQLSEAARENERLRELLKYSKIAPWKLQLARVIANDPANWWRSVHVDLGKRNGVRVDLPVVTTEGLVGRVAEVSDTRSKVLLLGDPKCRVPALIQEKESREHGVIAAGSSILDNSLVDLDFLPKGSALKPGQLVVTSGLGQIFPKGIIIGYVVDARPVEFGLYTKARVKLAVNLNQLEEVWVLFP